MDDKNSIETFKLTIYLYQQHRVFKLVVSNSLNAGGSLSKTALEL
jgi:hypothetical protein